MKAYFDGSKGTDENGDQWITLAGIAATDSVWAEFDQRWQKMLRARYPVAPYIHMIEILNGEDPFESLVGWDDCKKQSLVQDAITLLSQMNKLEFRMVWCSINESARQRLQREGIAVPESPVVHCTAACMFLTVGAYTLNVPDVHQEPFYIFYDRGEDFLGKFKQRYLQNRTKPGRPKNPDSFFDSFQDVQDVDQAYHPGIQAADMVSWGHTRSLSEKERPYHWLKTWLMKVVPSSFIEYTEEVMRNHRKDHALRQDFERIFR